MRIGGYALWNPTARAAPFTNLPPPPPRDFQQPLPAVDVDLDLADPRSPRQRSHLSEALLLQPHCSGRSNMICIHRTGQPAAENERLRSENVQL